MLTAFGASQDAERLAGGRGLTWRAGRVVLRPAGDPREAAWKSEALGELLSSGPHDGFTVPRPLRASGGEWVLDEWEALEWVPGAADQSRVDDVVRAGQAFHRAIAHLPRPDFIAASTDRWSIADRMAWGETRPSDGALFGDPLLVALMATTRPVASPAQVIHGDLLGNVLFAPGRPPAVIDWAPYWRPTGFGAAVAVADAACWHGLPTVALAESRGVAEWRQLLVRALAYRIATQHLAGRWDEAFARRHEPVVEAVLGLDE